MKKILLGLALLFVAQSCLGVPPFPTGTKQSGNNTFITNDTTWVIGTNGDTTLALWYDTANGKIVWVLGDTTGFSSVVASYVAAHSGSGSTDSGLVVQYAHVSDSLNKAIRTSGGTFTANATLTLGDTLKLQFSKTGSFLQLRTAGAVYWQWNQTQMTSPSATGVIGTGITWNGNAIGASYIPSAFPRNPTSLDSLGADLNMGGNDIKHLHYDGWALAGLNRINRYCDSTNMYFGWQGSSGYENLWKFNQNYFGAIGGGTYSPILMAPSIFLQPLGTPTGDSAAMSKKWIADSIAAAIAGVSVTAQDTTIRGIPVEDTGSGVTNGYTLHYNSGTGLMEWGADAGASGSYLLADGTDSMTGDLDMSGHSVLDVDYIGDSAGGDYPWVNFKSDGGMDIFCKYGSTIRIGQYGGLYWSFGGGDLNGGSYSRLTVDTIYGTTYLNLPKVNASVESDRTDTLYKNDTTFFYYEGDSLVSKMGSFAFYNYFDATGGTVLKNDSGITLNGGTGSPTFDSLLLETGGVISFNGLEMDSTFADTLINHLGWANFMQVDTGAATVTLTGPMILKEGSGCILGANTATNEVTVTLSGTGTGVFVDSGTFYMNPTAHDFKFYTENGSFWYFQDSLLTLNGDTVVYVTGDTMYFGNAGVPVADFFVIYDSLSIGGQVLDSATLAAMIAGNSGTVTDEILTDTLDSYFDTAAVIDSVQALLAAGPTITLPTLKLKQSASPTPTTEGVIEWNTTSGYIAVGWNGVATAVFKPVQDSASIGTNAVTSTHIKNNTIDTIDIKAGGVNTPELAANAVDSTKIQNSAVGTTEIADGSVAPGDVSTTGVFPFTGFYGPMTPSDVSSDPDDTLLYFANTGSGFGINTSKELYFKWTNLAQWDVPGDSIPDSAIGWSTQYLFAECLPVWNFDTTVAMSYPYYEDPANDTNYLFQCSSLVANDTVIGPKIRNNAQANWDADSIIVWVQTSRSDADSVKIDSLAFYITTASLHVDSLVVGNGTDRSVAGLTRYAYAFNYTIPAGSKVVTKPIMVFTEAGSWARIVDLQVQGRPL